MEGQRGRVSSAAVVLRPVVLLERPSPPAHLSAEAAREWREIVASMPADHFPRETWPMLEAYCRHTVVSRKVAALIEQLESEAGKDGELNLREWQRLLSLQDRENRAVSDLAMKMRLSQSSRYDASKGRRPSGIHKPWEG